MNVQRLLGAATVVALVALSAGCASSGPKHGELKESIPEIAPGNGRIYFYRDRSMLGAAVQPEIRLNGEVVGRSVPGGFFYVDRAPGNYEVATTTEVEYMANFTLDAGETRYVKTSVSMGVFVGRVTPALVESQQAVEELADLNFTGESPPAAGRAPASDGSTPPPASSRGDARPVDMNDLKDLLPQSK